MPSYRNGLVMLGTWTATTGFVPPPNVGPAESSRRSYPASPHQCVVCGPDTRGQRQLGGRWDCHTLCPDIGAGAPGQWAEAAPPQWLPEWPPTAWCRGHWLRLPLGSEALHPPLPTGFACCPPCPGPWDWGQSRPPQASFTQGAVRCLPFPVHTSQLFTFLNHDRPHLVQHTRFYPSLKSTMDGTIVTKSLGQMVPLATTTQAKDNSVKDWPWVDPLATSGFGRVSLQDNWLNFLPQIVRNLPNSFQRLSFPHWFHCFHLHPFGGSIKYVSNSVQGFEIVTK